MQDLRGTAQLKGSGYNLQAPAGPKQNPPAVTAAANKAIEARREALSKALQDSLKKQKDANPEPNVLEHIESIEIRIIDRDTTTRHTNAITTAGAISRLGAKGENSTLPDVYIMVVGAKLSLVGATDKTPVGPNPKDIWNDNPSAREAARVALTSEDVSNVVVTGRVVHQQQGGQTPKISKYGSKSLYTTRYGYVVLLEPALAKRLLDNLAKKGNARSLLQGVTHNKLLATGIREKLRQMLIGEDDANTTEENE